jgi:hypothetical protein
MKNSAGSADWGFVTSFDGFLPRNAAGKRSGPIEKIIAWAWREELPRAPSMKGNGPALPYSGWAGVSRYAELLSLVDLFGVNGFGVVPDFSADRWPCADAITICDAVMALDAVEIEMPEDWRPAPELDGFGGLGAKAVSDAWRRMTRDEGGRQILRVKVSDLIIKRAVMGMDIPAMRLDDPRVITEAHDNGKPKWFVRRNQDVIVGSNPDGSDVTEFRTIEANGCDKRGHPVVGAYQKQFLDPDPVATIIARAEHEIWHSALVAVYDSVASTMEEVEMLPPAVPVDPWTGYAPPRVLHDLKRRGEVEAAETKAKQDAFAARYPRWFKSLQAYSEKLSAPA